MIPVPSGVRVWLAVGRTDRRRGMNGLALQVQEAPGRDPHAGDWYVFRGVRGELIKIIWHDGIGVSLYTKRLEHGRFVWPSPADGTLAISGRSRPRSSPACSTGSIGDIRVIRSARSARDRYAAFLRVSGRDRCFDPGMAAAREDLPQDVDALKAALPAGRARAVGVAAELAVAKAKACDDQALIAHPRLQIEKRRRELYGQRSERTVRLLDQMELALEELASSATGDEVAAESAVAKTANVVAFTRKRPVRQPFPEHLPRERVVEPGPATCLCCGGARLRKLGEDWLHDLSIEMFPEDGCLDVYGVGEDGVTAFTECLRQIIADERTAGNAPPQVKSTE